METNFFERQRHLRRMSVRLVLLFAIAVVAIVATVDLVVLFAFGALTPGQSPGRIAGIVAVTSLATAGAVGLATLYRTATLRGGGGRVARELGGDLIPRDTTDPQLRRLLNIVEEIAIASGVPVPETYVLHNEPGINAFAAGWSTSDAAVAVTRGALERLNRDELQGVIAHEFSHVINGDMRLNIRLIGLLFGIMFLAVAGDTILRAGAFSRSRDEKSGGNPLPLIGLALIVAGYAGVLIGRIIKASVSRKREYLADASAVQFTRQTTGIAGALKKIAGLSTGSRLNSPKTEEVTHMLFGSGRRKESIFATHPPLADRIRVLDPAFDPAQLDSLAAQWAQHPPVGLAEDAALGLTPAAPIGAEQRPAQPGPAAQARPTAESIVARVAAPAEADFSAAAALLDRIPPGLRTAAYREGEVVPLVLGLLLSADPQISARQQSGLRARFGDRIADTVAAMAESAQRLDPALRLPLAELAFPTLRHRPVEERQSILDAVDELIHADGRISTFEYCFSTLLRNDLYQSMHPPPHRHAETRTLNRCRAEVTTLLSVLAKDETAFTAGMAVALPHLKQPFNNRPVTELDPVWHVLRELRPDGKETLIRAAVEVIDHDRAMTVEEMELLRTICGLLHCPLPPIAVGPSDPPIALARI